MTGSCSPSIGKHICDDLYDDASKKEEHMSKTVDLYRERWKKL